MASGDTGHIGTVSVDPRFGQARNRARDRQRRKRLRQGLVLVIIALILLSGAGAAGWWWMTTGPSPPRTAADAPAQPTTAAPGAQTDEAAPSDFSQATPERERPRFIDLPGEPLRITSGKAGQSARPHRVPRPADLPDTRGGRGDILVIRDSMIPAGERLSVALPTSQEDFAIFQAQRRDTGAGRSAGRPAETEAASRAPRARPRNVAEAHALLAYHARSSQGGQASTTPDGFGAMRLRAPETRQPLVRETVLRIDRSAPTEEVLRREGLPAPEAQAVAEAARAQLDLSRLDVNHILALRWLTPASGATGERRFVQAAFYAPNRYLGALARTRPPAHAGRGTDGAADSAIGTGADPWIDRDLTALLEDGAQAAAPQGAPRSDPRLMDALYGAALRQELPPRLVGQLIMLLSEAHDLDAKANPEDRLTLVMGAQPAPDDTADTEAGALDRVLFVGIDSAEAGVRCYVYRPDPETAPTCYGPGDGTSRARPAQSGGTERALGGNNAIATLVDRIIQVESAGQANAKNPLSSATGLGQFIDSTWLRMMRVYRPDLTAQHSRAELLAMRTDPALSREMVEHLAAEGAAFLRARGHTITAGRLYLAHFLGMEGAHTALAANPETDLKTLFGAGVINANPFLRGHDAGYVVQWAENKMSGASGRVAVIREPEGLDDFRALVDEMLSAG